VPAFVSSTSQDSSTALCSFFWTFNLVPLQSTTGSYIPLYHSLDLYEETYSKMQCPKGSRANDKVSRRGFELMCVYYVCNASLPICLYTPPIPKASLNAIVQQETSQVVTKVVKMHPPIRPCKPVSPIRLAELIYMSNPSQSTVNISLYMQLLLAHPNHR